LLVGPSDRHLTRCAVLSFLTYRAPFLPKPLRLASSHNRSRSARRRLFQGISTPRSSRTGDPGRWLNPTRASFRRSRQPATLQCRLNRHCPLRRQLILRFLPDPHRS
jgi:hypothetical protein